MFCVSISPDVDGLIYAISVTVLKMAMAETFTQILKNKM